MNINIIVAYCKNNGIGYENNLPWNIKSDLNQFKNLTTGNKNNAVIMGKNTWLSINKTLGLPNRDNFIISTSLDIDTTNNSNIIKSFKTYQDMFNFIKLKKYDDIWIIGGEKIYKDFLNSNSQDLLVKKIYITYIDKEFECDTFFPIIDTNKFKFISKEIFPNNLNNEYEIYNILYERN